MEADHITPGVKVEKQMLKIVRCYVENVIAESRTNNVQNYNKKGLQIYMEGAEILLHSSDVVLLIT